MELLPCQWRSETTISLLSDLLAYLHWNTVHVSSVVTAAFATGGKSSHDRLPDHCVYDNTISKVVMPYYTPAHWALIFLRLDHEKKTWSAELFDSFGKNSRSLDEAERTIVRLTDIS